MNLRNSKVVLTIKLEGRIAVRSDNSSSRKLQRLVMSHGIKSTNDYNPPKFHECVKRMILNEDQVNFMISDKGSIYKDRSRWKGLNQKLRLECHLRQITEGSEFSYEVIN